MSKVAEKFCTYCNSYRPPDLFKVVRTGRAGTPRMMCQPCVDIRKKPREELEALAKRDSDERKRR